MKKRAASPPYLTRRAGLTAVSRKKRAASPPYPRSIFRRALPALVGLLAGAALVGLAIPALGDDDSPHPVATAAGAGHLRMKGFVSKSSGLRVKYVAGTGTAPPSAEDGFVIRCPKKTPHAISAFFGPSTQEGLGQVVMSDSLPDPKNGRTWDVGVKNLSATPQPYVAGVVCVK